MTINTFPKQLKEKSKRGEREREREREREKINGTSIRVLITVMGQTSKAAKDLVRAPAPRMTEFGSVLRRCSEEEDEEATKLPVESKDMKGPSIEK